MCRIGAVVLLLAVGCSGSRPAGDAGSGGAVAVLSGIGSTLAAAEEEGEFTGILTEPEPEPVVPVIVPPRLKRFGVRTGLLMPMGAEEGEWGSAFLAGVFYRFNQLAEKKMALELGVDFSSVGRDDGSVTSTLLVFRGELLFGKGGPGAPANRTCPLFWIRFDMIASAWPRRPGQLSRQKLAQVDHFWVVYTPPRRGLFPWSGFRRRPGSG